MRKVIFSARKSDFDIDTFCTGGPGGQNQNRNKNGVRITHRETGLSAESRTFKSQSQNLKSAFRKLAKQLVDRVIGDTTKARNAAGDEVVRSYHEPDNRVKDHASGAMATYDETLEGRLDALIAARRQAKE